MYFQKFFTGMYLLSFTVIALQDASAIYTKSHTRSINKIENNIYHCRCSSAKPLWSLVLFFFDESPPLKFATLRILRGTRR